MLTEKDILRLYREGVVVCLRRKRHSKRIWGDYNPETLEANAYLPDIPSKQDLYETIVHELIHARDDNLEYQKLEDTKSSNAGSAYIHFDKTELERKWAKMDTYDDDAELERAVIAEARETCENCPEVLGVIMALYNIKDSIK